MQRQVLLQRDVSQTGWGTSCQEISAGGMWTKEEQKFHINALELLAVKLALLAVTNKEKIKSVHFQIDNKTALSYLLKIGGTEKTFGVFFIFKGITITTE